MSIMTTINPQVSGIPNESSVLNVPAILEGATAIPAGGSLEQLAGLPTAAELSAIANSLFPDLTGDVENVGMPSVNQWEHELMQYALHELKGVKGLTLVGTAANKSSALSFKLDGYSDDEVGARLDSYGIAVRVGHHCAQPVLRHFGYESVVRPTIAFYNSPDDIDKLVRVLKTFA